MKRTPVKRKVKFSVSVPAEPCYLRVVRQFFRAAVGESLGDAAENVILAVDESCANVLKHRPATCEGEDLEVSAELSSGSVRFRIRQFCRRGDVPRIKPRPLGEVRPGGLGTHFVESIMDRVFYDEPEVDDDESAVDLVLEKKIDDLERPVLEQSTSREEPADGAASE